MRTKIFSKLIVLLLLALIVACGNNNNMNYKYEDDEDNRITPSSASNENLTVAPPHILPPVIPSNLTALPQFINISNSNTSQIDAVAISIKNLTDNLTAITHNTTNINTTMQELIELIANTSISTANTKASAPTYNYTTALQALKDNETALRSALGANSTAAQNQTMQLIFNAIDSKIDMEMLGANFPQNLTQNSISQSDKANVSIALTKRVQNVANSIVNLRAMRPQTPVIQALISSLMQTMKQGNDILTQHKSEMKGFSVRFNFINQSIYSSCNKAMGLHIAYVIQNSDSLKTTKLYVHKKLPTTLDYTYESFFQAYFTDNKTDRDTKQSNMSIQSLDLVNTIFSLSDTTNVYLFCWMNNVRWVGESSYHIIDEQQLSGDGRYNITFNINKDYGNVNDGQYLPNIYDDTHLNPTQLPAHNIHNYSVESSKPTISSLTLLLSTSNGEAKGNGVADNSQDYSDFYFRISLMNGTVTNNTPYNGTLPPEESVLLEKFGSLDYLPTIRIRTFCDGASLVNKQFNRPLYIPYGGHASIYFGTHGYYEYWSWLHKTEIDWFLNNHLVVRQN